MFFENSSLKGISGQNMSDPLKWSLTDDSRFLQAAILKIAARICEVPVVSVHSRFTIFHSRYLFQIPLETVLFPIQITNRNSGL